VIKSYADLGEAPKDSLAALEWAYRMNAVSLREIAIDPAIRDESHRRGEISRITKTMNATIPKVRLFLAEKRILDEQRRIALDKDPELEDAPTGRPTRGASTASSPAAAPPPGTELIAPGEPDPVLGLRVTEDETVGDDADEEETDDDEDES
jgi:hypothetical protein